MHRIEVLVIASTNTSFISPRSATSKPALLVSKSQSTEALVGRSPWLPLALNIIKLLIGVNIVFFVLNYTRPA